MSVCFDCEFAGTGKCLGGIIAGRRVPWVLFTLPADSYILAGIEQVAIGSPGVIIELDVSTGYN